MNHKQRLQRVTLSSGNPSTTNESISPLLRLSLCFTLSHLGLGTTIWKSRIVKDTIKVFAVMKYQDKSLAEI